MINNTWMIKQPPLGQKKSNLKTGGPPGLKDQMIKTTPRPKSFFLIFRERSMYGCIIQAATLLIALHC